MWCNLNSPTPEPAARTGRQARFCLASPVDRRAALKRLLGALGLLACPLATWAASPAAGFQRWGSGEYRRFGFLVYEASLWAAADPQQPPLALRLDYRRRIAGRAIAEASVNEMRPFVRDEARLAQWGERMAQLFPDVQDGDHLLGVWAADGARFYQGERLIGEVRDADFARAFFAIWLDPRTSAPALRAQLLTRPGG